MAAEVQVEREVLHRLPSLFADVVGVTAADVQVRREVSGGGDDGLDVVLEACGRRWLVEVKSSAGPSTVADAARQLEQLRGVDETAVGLLVVPHMTPAGAREADRRGVNWVDLSGNARLRAEGLFVQVEGRPNLHPQRGRPASAFAPKSARVARLLLLDPSRWRRQRDLVETTGLDDGHLSRIVRRLDAEGLLERDGSRFRPRDPDLLLDTWADAYRFDRHDVVLGHLSGTGVELASLVHEALATAGVGHAFTGLAAAWALDSYAQFRLCSVYVTGDPRDHAEVLRLRRGERGANVQLIGPDDAGVFDGQRQLVAWPCVSPVQVYLDLGHLPERAADAAGHLRESGLLWGIHG